MITGFIETYVHLIAPVSAMVMSQMIKTILCIMKDKRANWPKIFAPGGMPSSHSALVTALSTSIGITYGFTGYPFAIAAMFALVVIYDAASLRQAVGHQAVAINKIYESVSDVQKMKKKLREVHGHTIQEVLAGIILGIAVALFLH